MWLGKKPSREEGELTFSVPLELRKELFGREAGDEQISSLPLLEWWLILALLPRYLSVPKVRVSISSAQLSKPLVTSLKQFLLEEWDRTAPLCP